MDCYLSQWNIKVRFELAFGFISSVDIPAMMLLNFFYTVKCTHTFLQYLIITFKIVVVHMHVCHLDKNEHEGLF